MRRILITGATRGIGFELTQAYLHREDTLIFATYRRPNTASALQSLAKRFGERLRLIPLEVTQAASIDESVQQVQSHVDGLDLLINNAGVLPGGVDAPEAGSAAFGALQAAAMLRVFEVNTVAPVIVAQAYAGLLRRGTKPLLVNLSSDAGSLAMREGGCNYSYPASKAALNMMTRCLAGDFRPYGVTVVSVHPGWIQTDMGGTRAPLQPADTLPTLMRVIDKLTMGDSGTFLNWDGSSVPW